MTRSPRKEEHQAVKVWAQMVWCSVRIICLQFDWIYPEIARLPQVRQSLSWCCSSYRQKLNRFLKLHFHVIGKQLIQAVVFHTVLQSEARCRRRKAVGREYPALPLSWKVRTKLPKSPFCERLSLLQHCSPLVIRNVRTSTTRFACLSTQSGNTSRSHPIGLLPQSLLWRSRKTVGCLSLSTKYPFVSFSITLLQDYTVAHFEIW